MDAMRLSQSNPIAHDYFLAGATAHISIRQNPDPVDPKSRPIMALFDGFATTPDWARKSYVAREDEGRDIVLPTSATSQTHATSEVSAFARLSRLDEEELIAACHGGDQGIPLERRPREELEALDQKIAGVGSGPDEDFIHHLDRLIVKYKLKLPEVQVGERCAHRNMTCEE